MPQTLHGLAHRFRQKAVIRFDLSVNKDELGIFLHESSRSFESCGDHHRSYRTTLIVERYLKLTHRMQNSQHGLDGIREDHGFETKAFFSRIAILMKNDPTANAKHGLALERMLSLTSSV